MKEIIKKFIETNDNEEMRFCPKIYGTPKAVIRAKLIAIQTL